MAESLLLCVDVERVAVGRARLHSGEPALGAVNEVGESSPEFDQLFRRRTIGVFALGRIDKRFNLGLLQHALMDGDARAVGQAQFAADGVGRMEDAKGELSHRDYCRFFQSNMVQRMGPVVNRGLRNRIS
jgi:hypothetical protein